MPLTRSGSYSDINKLKQESPAMEHVPGAYASVKADTANPAIIAQPMPAAERPGSISPTTVNSPTFSSFVTRLHNSALLPPSLYKI